MKPVRDLVVINETATTAYQPIDAGNPTDNVAIIERVFYQYIPNPLHLYVVDTITVASTAIGEPDRVCIGRRNCHRHDRFTWTSAGA